jgi:hypothetical protein
MIEDKGWGAYVDPPEVIPQDDLLPHARGEDCPCKPIVREGVIVHNSFDLREDEE